jgi:hypothetical protein
MTARRDPIVEEVRKHRATIAAEHGNRLKAILAAFQREEADWPAGTVSRPPKVLATQTSKTKGHGTRRPNKRLHRTTAREER